MPEGLGLGLGLGLAVLESKTVIDSRLATAMSTPTTKLLVLGAQAVREALPMAAAIDAMRAAFVGLADGTAVQPHRVAIDVAGRGTAAAMAAFVPALGLAGKAHRRGVGARHRAAGAEAGHLVAAERAGVTRRSAWTTLGDVVRGVAPGRAPADERTVFVSVGQAAQDVAAAARIVEVARTRGLGVEIDLA